jgi:hypothetical protein
MDGLTFAGVLANQLTRIQDVLDNKSVEYATEDRLHNFKMAANLQNTNPKNALAGMMAKHTISIYDMCRSRKLFPPEVWDEKITDHINYLVLLRALVAEEWEEVIVEPVEHMYMTTTEAISKLKEHDQNA